MQKKILTYILFALLLVIIVVLYNAKLRSSSNEEQRSKEQQEYYDNVQAAIDYENEDLEKTTYNLLKELKEHPHNGYASHYLAVLYYTSEDYDDAELLFDRCIEDLPYYEHELLSSSYHLKAAISFMHEEDEDALSYITSAINETPDNFRLYERRASIYKQLGDSVSAKSDFEIAEKLKSAEAE